MTTDSDISIDMVGLAAYFAALATPPGRIVAPPFLPSPPPPFEPDITCELWVDGFIGALERALAGKTVGYTFLLQQSELPISYGLAIDPQSAGGSGSLGQVPFTRAVRMNVASCSKLLTAMALVRLLTDRGIGADQPMSIFLPEYWDPQGGARDITFADLMTHRSGLLPQLAAGDSGPCDFLTAKNAIITGPDMKELGPNATPIYRNVNYALCRILIATLNQDIAPGWTTGGAPIFTDVLWDITTARAYEQYVQRHILAPSGVGDATLARPADCALAYNFPPDIAGWNSGDLTFICGPNGWHMSVDDLLAVMGTFRRAGTIVSPALAQQMLENGFGIDITQYSSGGLVAYGKSGGWFAGTGSKLQAEQSILFFLPDEMEFVLFVNSPVGADNENFVNLVLDAYNANVICR